MRINIPKDVEYILSKLNEAGFEAYVVGGCVRDAILGAEPHDWDITTNARPEDVMGIFSHVIPSGLAFGTVSVHRNGEFYEVTTYRNDGRYSDGRHPDEVAYADTLQEDVHRRDLTINALAYNNKVGLVDYVGGLQDLNNGVIRFVGNARERLNEDPLRALRAVRFAARYNFSIDEETMGECLSVFTERGNCVSPERVHEEFIKFFSGRKVETVIDYTLLDLYVRLLAIACPKLQELYGVSQYNPAHIYDLYNHTLHTLQYTTVYNDYILAMAAILHDIGKKRVKTIGDDGVEHFIQHPRESVIVGRLVLASLRFSKEETRKILFLVKNHDIFISGYRIHKVRKFLAGVDKEAVDRLILIKRADESAKNPARANPADVDGLETVFYDVMNEGTNITLKELDINGNDILAIGVNDVANIKEVLRECLDICYLKPENNNKAYLCNFASRLIIRKGY